MAHNTAEQDRLYSEAAASYGIMIERLARGYEYDADKARDLVQEIHVALWRSFAGFAGECALSTWIYRVAHNVGATYVAKTRRTNILNNVEDADIIADDSDLEKEVTHERALRKLHNLIHRLAPQDRQIIMLYLEDVSAREIADITGLNAGNISVKIHRIKQLLASNFAEGEPA